jgi:hypothetical protein
MRRALHPARGLVEPATSESSQRRIEHANSVAVIFLHQALEVRAAELAADRRQSVP